MKVSELIEKLKEMPQDQDIVVQIDNHKSGKIEETKDINEVTSERVHSNIVGKDWNEFVAIRIVVKAWNGYFSRYE